MMKATIDLDDALYRRLKVEAARRGRTVRDLVAEGIRHVLDTPASTSETSESDAWRPAWFGALRQYASVVDDHSMGAVKRSVDRGRLTERQR